VLAVKDFRVRFRVDARTLTVLEITSGYRARVLADPHAHATELTPLSVHRDFSARFSAPA